MTQKSAGKESNYISSETCVHLPLPDPTTQRALDVHYDYDDQVPGVKSTVPAFSRTPDTPRRDQKSPRCHVSATYVVSLKDRKGRPVGLYRRPTRLR